jgi:branched-chain amino acid transport system permease protein
MASVPATRKPLAFSSSRFWVVRLGSIALFAAAAYAFQSFAMPHLGIYDIRLLVLSLLFATLAVSLNLINGITGQFSMGHAAFYLIGAYTSGKITVTFFQGQPLAQPIWLLMMMAVGAIAAAIAGYLVGLPSLRLRGDYLAIVTLGFGEIARVLVINQDGSDKSFWGLNLGGASYLQIAPKMTEMWHLALLLAIAIAVSRNLLKTGHGLAFLAVREDEIAAEATGVNTTRIKVTAFVLGAAIAGMAGALFAHYNGPIAPDDFKMDVSFLVVTMVVIGGTGSITGAAAAGVLLKLLEEFLRALAPLPAIDLIAGILSAITVLVLYRYLRSAASPDGKGKRALAAFGVAGCAAAAFAGYKLAAAPVSVVFKIAGLALITCMLVGFLGTRHRSTALPRLGLLSLAVALVLAIRIPLAALIHKIGFIETAMGTTEYTPGDLRWAVFAVLLIVVMLVRPQGIFGHHEFSWDFVKSLFGRSSHHKAVEA